MFSERQKSRSADTAARELARLFTGLANRILRLDPENLERLGDFEGKIIALAPASAPAPTLHVRPSAEGFHLLAAYDGDADVTLRGTVPAFVRLAAGGSAAELMGATELVIEGDLDLGRRFQRFLAGLHIDWEEQAARVIGDLAAHQLCNVMRDLGAWRRQATQALSADIREYLQEESRMLAPPTRVDTFLRAVDQLRADADRLEARLGRLQARG
jgi:ubiquinone biosynthesis accessory factor UbiJ